MRLSFDDEGSFKEAVESLRFNKNRINPNTSQQTAGIRSSNSMSLNSEDFEVNEVCGPWRYCPKWSNSTSASGEQQKSEYAGESHFGAVNGM